MPSRISMIFAVTLALMSGPAAGAQNTVLVRAADLTPSEYTGWLDANPQFKTLIAHYEENFPAHSQGRQLMRTFEKAQTAFLSGSIPQARHEFRVLVEMAYQADWMETQREAILYGFLRLAQLAESKEAKKHWLEQAVSFAPDLKPDADLFPPPLRDEHRSLRNAISKSYVQLRPFEKFHGYEILKVNGRPYRIQRDLIVTLPPGPQRISLLSNAYPYFSQVLTSSQLQVLRVDVPPLTLGTCDEPDLNESARDSIGSTGVLYSSSCLRILTAAGWIDADNPLSPPKPDIAKRKRESELFPEIHTRQRKRMRKAWLWVGVSTAALAAGYLVYKDYRHDVEGRRSQESSANETIIQPVTREGF